MKNLIRSLILISLMFNIGLSHAAFQPFKNDPQTVLSLTIVGYTVCEYCDAPTLLNLARVSSKSGRHSSDHLGEIKKWKDGGGLLVALFGTPQDQDVQYLGKLPQWCKGVDHNMGVDQVKRLLLSCVYISDPLVAQEVSDKVMAFIDTFLTISSRQKYQLKQLLPKSHNYELGQLLTGDNYDWLDGESLDVSFKDKKKILARLLKRPTQPSDRPSEVSSVLLYLYKTPNVRVKYCKAFVRQWLESSDLTLSDLSLIQIYSNFFGYYREVEVTVERMIDHPDMKPWMRWMMWYITIISKPYTNYVLLPLSRTYKTVSLLGGMLVGAAKRRFAVK
jgi:hypothetical protein